ncbi:hypothetical protein ANAPRD1_00434 [Anaplasma phagocytophilum]|nr:hypothetical protein ANAPRD1_00434 [Anaplasma phagocytophilum]
MPAQESINGLISNALGSEKPLKTSTPCVGFVIVLCLVQIYEATPEKVVRNSSTTSTINFTVFLKDVGAKNHYCW